MPKQKVYITDTILRDAHQSQAATRMRTDDSFICICLITLSTESGSPIILSS